MWGAQLRRHFWGLSQSLKHSFKLLVSWITRSASLSVLEEGISGEKTGFWLIFPLIAALQNARGPSHTTKQGQGPPLGPHHLLSPPSVLCLYGMSALPKSSLWTKASLKPMLIETAFTFALGTQRVCLHTFSGRNLALIFFPLSSSFITQNLWLLINKGEYIKLHSIYELCLIINHFIYVKTHFGSWPKPYINFCNFKG